MTAIEIEISGGTCRKANVMVFETKYLVEVEKPVMIYKKFLQLYSQVSGAGDGIGLRKKETVR